MNGNTATGKKVSIISPCYNSEKYIKKLLDSVLNQDYSTIEFIAVNDGSTDDTLKILNNYKKYFKRKGIEYVVLNKDNGGAASAINSGLKVFTGEYITFIDSDDFLNENSISRRVEFLEKNEQYDVVYSATNVVDETDYSKIISIKKRSSDSDGDNLFLSMIKEENYIWTHSYFVRSKFFLSTHPKRHIAEFKAGQNIQLFLPLWREARVGYIEDSLVTIVQHNDSHSRLQRSHKGVQTRNNDIEEIYLDTISKIDMPHKEKQEYTEIIKQKHQKKRKKVYEMISGSKDELGRLYEYDEQKFREHYVSDISTANQHQLASKMIFSSHSLEKSLSNDNFEIGHGFKVSRLLVDMLKTYEHKGYDKNDLSYISTLSVLKVFYERHKGTEFTGEIEQIFDSFNDTIMSCDSLLGGSDTILKADKKNNYKKNFRELAENRFAVRMYSGDPVDKQDIKDAVQIAMKTPTVCNRQSIRVYEIYEKEVIEAVLKVQGGIEYYDTPPVLLLVAANDNGYVGPNERNQGFVDGGLFAMSLLYAFEYKGLAACPLHAMLNERKEKTVRGMLDLPDSDKLITFMSVGHFNETNNVCKSFRYSADHILREKNKLHDFVIQDAVKQKPVAVSKVKDSIYVAIKKRVRVRTRLRNLKHKTRVRTRIREYAEKEREKRAEKIRYDMINHPHGAIVTLTDYFNYGNMLQRYALQRFLQKKGYRFISYAQEAFDVSDKKFDRLRNTIPFVQQRIYRKPYDVNDDYKYYITGSDQVWRKWGGDGGDDPFANVRYFMFDFIKNDQATRIAYAASFGQSDILSARLTEEFMDSVKPLINKMNAVSVREADGAKLVKKYWDVDASVTVDPTMLLDSKDYDALIQKPTMPLREPKSCFAYILGSSDNREDCLRKISKSLNADIDTLYLKEDDKLPSVEQWIMSIKAASFVVTDSFHGMVFCIIYKTPFIVLENEFGGASRIVSLLSELGIQDRFIRDKDLKGFNVNELNDINWRHVSRRLNNLRGRSSKWLLKALSEGGR